MHPPSILTLLLLATTLCTTTRSEDSLSTLVADMREEIQHASRQYGNVHFSLMRSKWLEACPIRLVYTDLVPPAIEMYKVIVCQVTAAWVAMSSHHDERIRVESCMPTPKAVDNIRLYLIAILDGISRSIRMIQDYAFVVTREEAGILADVVGDAEVFRAPLSRNQENNLLQCTVLPDTGEEPVSQKITCSTVFVD